MKPMLANDFRKKVHMIPEEDLSQFLAEGFESYLPDEMKAGKVDSTQLVKDFVAYRKRVE
jgi:hypothetical protein